MLVGIGGVAIPAICCRNRVASFSPTDITGLAAWYKADGAGAARDGSDNIITTDNTNVAKLWDFSGQNKHATQTTSGLQPKYRTAANGLAGLPAIQFLPSNLNASNLSRNGWTAFIVFKASTAGRLYIHGNDYFAPGGYLQTSATISSVPTVTFREASGSVVNGRFYTSGWGSDNVLKLATSRFNGTNVSNIMRINGSPVTLTSDNPSLAGDPGTATVTATFNLSGQTNATDFGAAYYLGELVIYNYALSDTDVGKVETYLKAKWGL